MKRAPGAVIFAGVAAMLMLAPGAGAATSGSQVWLHRLGDNSPNQHASKHNASTGHPIITSFEHGENWFYDYRTGDFFTGPKLAGPHAHPLDQPVPGPAGQVPEDWQSLLHE